MLSKEGQKSIMEKNYMFPVVKGVKDGTPFGSVPDLKTVSEPEFYDTKQVDHLLKRWSEIRRSDSN
jgi:thiamine transport system substrate-binding protein